MRNSAIIDSSGITRRTLVQMAACLVMLCGSGCLGEGGAINVRWRIAERETGRVDDPRDDSDANGVCCQAMTADGTCNPAGWEIVRVQLVLRDPDTGVQLASPTTGLDSKCGARELTTPFELPEGQFDVTLQAYDPANPTTVEAQSPGPEERTVHRAEIVNLDVVELSVSAMQMR